MYVYLGKNSRKQNLTPSILHFPAEIAKKAKELERSSPLVTKKYYVGLNGAYQLEIDVWKITASKTNAGRCNKISLSFSPDGLNRQTSAFYHNISLER